MEEKQKKTPKRLLIDIDVDLHSKIKARAAARNITLKTYITRAILRAIAEEQKYE